MEKQLETNFKTGINEAEWESFIAAMADLNQDINILLERLLWGQMQSMGLFQKKVTLINERKKNSGLIALYDKWLDESIAVMVSRNYLQYDGTSYIVNNPAPIDMSALWPEWEQKKATWQRDPDLKAKLNLVEVTLRNLPEILTGKVPATDIIFPDASMKLVEGIYKHNRVADYFNEVVAEIAAAYIAERLREEPYARIRMIEIGAGTGGASSAIFRKLVPYQGQIQEYCYTDLSNGFLTHAQKAYGPETPYLTYQLFDIEKPPAEQGIQTGGYDLAIAANVLHATENIRRTLRNVKATLKKNGILLLNELSGNSLFAHLTFGLLKGWWLYEDTELRIPGCPGLYPQTWQAVLEDEGFQAVFFPVEADHQLGTQVIAAESDGVVRLRQFNLSGGLSKGLAAETAISHLQGGLENSGIPENRPISEFVTTSATDLTGQRIEAQLKEFITNKLSEMLKITLDKIEADKSFADYGLDSITGIHFIQALNQDLELNLTTTNLYDYSSVNQLAKHIYTEHKDGITKVLSQIMLQTNMLQVSTGSATEEAGAKPAMPLPQMDISRFSSGEKRENDGFTTREPIAIIGMSGRYARSKTVDELWAHLSQGTELIEAITRWDLKKNAWATNQCRHGSFLDDLDQFDPSFFNISGLEATYMDPQQRFFLEESWKALEDSGYAGRVSGRICGIYLGHNESDYKYLFEKQPNIPDIPPQAMWGNAASIIPARIAYYLNLHGPAITVDTACSSSLVAVHLACQGLWGKETEMAIAGGVFIQCTPRFYSYASRTGMLSAAGHCYTFDERADGFVPGEGVGVVILKRLQEAIRDGDQIYGVIRGSGINQDGTTNGITAPSANSQERLERYVYDTFHIDPAEISMVEAHGTGTKLGDPIEYEALTRAFRHYTAKQEYCAIGSIKTNLGHTTAAAGVTGLIKILLSLKYRRIPASLNYQSGNSRIRFPGSPFYVNTRLKDWQVGPDRKRCAAISAFGFSGTNAHMVIEEAPEIEQFHPEKPGYLMVLSARNPEQLNRQIGQMIDFCAQEIPVDLGNMSYTLLLGRRHFNHRLAFVVRSRQEFGALLKKVLETGKAPWVYRAELLESDRREQQSPFKQYGNQCIQNCRNNSRTTEYFEQLAVIAELYVQGYELDYEGLYADEPYRIISLPTYPFARERYWVPAVESALNETTGVADVIHPLLQQNISDLAEQKYRSIFTGREFFLTDHRIMGRMILPGVATLEMARAAVEAATNQAAFKLKNVVWRQPVEVGEKPVSIHIGLNPKENGEIGYEIYCLAGNGETGEVIYSQGSAERIDHKNNPVLDLKALQAACNGQVLTGDEIYRIFTTIGFDYGPGHQGIERIYVGRGTVLAKLSLPSVVAGTTEQYVLHPSMMDGALQAAIGMGAGETERETRQEVYLPFALEELEVYHRCTDNMWAFIQYSKDYGAVDQVRKLDVDLCDEQGNVCVHMKGYSSRVLENGFKETGASPAIESIMLERVWNEQAIDTENSIGISEYGKQLVIFCEPAKLRPEVMKSGPNGFQVVNLQSGQESINKRYESYAVQLLEVIQKIFNEKPVGKVLVQLVISRGEEERLFRGLSGILKTAQLENAKVIGQVIEIEEMEKPEVLITRLIENSYRPMDALVRYRKGQRQVAGWRQVTVAPAVMEIPWRDGGVYLITGGAGGLGMIFAGEIRNRVKEATLVLTGRSPWLSETKQAQLKELEASGAKVEYRSLDVSDGQAATELIQSIVAAYGKLDGIIHSAGIIRDNFIINKNQAELQEVLAPKVSGLVNLDQASQDLKLDFMILFSAIAGSLGNPGQADYAAANAFMDEYADYRNQLVNTGRRQGWTLSIGWPLWQEGGMRVKAAVEKMLRQTMGMAAMQTATGIRALYAGIASGKSQLLVIEGDLPLIRREVLLAETPVMAQSGNNDADEIVPAGYDNGSLRERIQGALIPIVSKLLKVKIENIDINTEFNEYGFDSISLTEFGNILNRELGLALAPTIFFEYPTLNYFSEYLAKEYRTVLANRFMAHEIQAAPTVAIMTENPLKQQPRRSRFADKGILAVKADIPTPEIAIVGMSGIFPQAGDLEEFWHNLLTGKDCITEIPKDRWDWEEYYGDPRKETNKTNIKWGGFINGVAEFDPLFFGISPREAELMDPQQRLLMMYVWKAIEDAGYSAESLSGTMTGIFVGTSGTGYDGLIARANLPIEGYSATGIAASVGPNRMSYFLNIHGPSEPVETACSSSLVAIHRAVSAIENGSCEMAIAGGINTILTPWAHISFNKAGMLSEDGRCKTFSDKANGYARGEGAGILFLKKLTDAEQSGDHIYGIIRGTAENHGGRANSLTAPNPKAQAELLQTVYRKAGIDPRTVTYIETHGTGTELGDPVEINGLKMAFQELYKATGDPVIINGYCGLGSVKTNIGHLELAAGVAGVIKILLQLRHKTLVKSLYCDTVNPYIQLKDSPFYIVQENRAWERLQDDRGQEIPRRAGVSSFGFGGVNAHVIIEEYIPQKRQPSTKMMTGPNPALIVLSAKTEQQLKERVEQLVREIQSQRFSDSDLAALAYTLQVGREAMEERFATVAGSIRELETKLLSFLEAWDESVDLYRGQVKRDPKNLAAFAGDEDLAQTVAAWINKRKYGKLLDLWVKGLRIDWNSFYGDVKPQRISLPTYPFAKDRYWIGESGTRFNTATGGGITTFIHPLLQQNTSNLSELRFSSTFTGQEFFLADHRVNGHKVLPGVVYLEMARAAVEVAAVFPAEERRMIRLENIVWARSMKVDEPVRVHIGLYPDGGDGDTGIAYEIYSLAENDENETVVYCQGKATLLENTGVPVLDLQAIRAGCNQNSFTAAEIYDLYKTIGLDYGSGQQGIEAIYIGLGMVMAKLSLPSAVADTGELYGLHPSMMDGSLQAAIGMGAGEAEPMVNSRVYLPFALAELEVYRRCTGNMWAVIQSGKDNPAGDNVRKLDIDVCDDQGQVCVRMKGYSSRILDKETKAVNLPATTGKIIFEPVWKAQIAGNIHKSSKITDYSQRLAILCEPGNIDLKPIESGLNGVRVLSLQSTATNIAERYLTYANQVFVEIQKLMAEKPVGEALVQLIVTGGAEQSLFTGLAGILKTAQMENPQVIGQVIELDAVVDPAGLIDILNENSFHPGDSLIRYRENKREVAGWNEVTVPEDRVGIPWKDKGIYLITGGAGGLGMIFAQEITERVKEVILILTGRSSLTGAKQTQLRELECNGAKIKYRIADVTDQNAVQELIRNIRMEYGKLDGIIHSAGVIRDNYILKKTTAELQEVLAPKVSGLVNLDEASKDLNLDFMILFSSVTGIMGNPGQADYAAANAFMDAYAGYRHSLVNNGQRRGRTLSINWPLWQDGGMMANETVEKMLKQKAGVVALRTSAGIQALYEGIASAGNQVMVLEGDISHIRSLFRKQTEFSAYNAYNQKPGAKTAADSGLLREKTSQYLKQLLAPVIKLPVERIETDAPLEKYGIDSVMALELTNQLEKSFGSLSKTLFFEYQTIRELSGYFSRSYPEQLTRLLAIAIPEETTNDAGTETTTGPVMMPVIHNRKRPRFTGYESTGTNKPLDIAVIGIAGRYPQARNLEAYWRNLRDGKDCITEIPKDRWDYRQYFDETKGKPGKTYSKWGGFLAGVDEFDPLFFNISPKEAEVMDPQERLFLECVYETLEDAGYTRETLSKYQGLGLEGNVGVYVGVMYLEYQLYGAQAQVQGFPVALSGSASSIANRVSYYCNFHGPSMAIDTMCSSSLTAIHLACRSIRHGGCEMAIAGGVNVSIHPNKYLALGQGKFVSSKGRCESFGLGGDGYVPGEGVGAVLLKPLSKAIAEGDHIYGVIKGTAINHGGKTNGYTVPNPNAQTGVIEQALRESGINPGVISYIEAHGTGTSLGDPIEITGLVKAFRQYTGDNQFCAIGSAKSNIGHCESAAGIAGVTKVLLQMKHRQIAPSLHSETLNPNIDFSQTPFIVQQELSAWERPVVTHAGETREYPRIAGISSFGAGGSNAHILIEEYIPGKSNRPAAAIQSPTPALIVLSAKNPERLKERVEQLVAAINEERITGADLTDMAYTLQTGREAMEERIGIIAGSMTEIARKLEAYLAGQEEIEELYRGRVKRNTGAIAVFTTDEDLQQAVETWIAKRKYGKLLEFWVQGVVFDWNRLYGENKPRRISLPAYPFARERYWMPEINVQPGKDSPVIPETTTLSKPEKTVLIKDWQSKAVNNGLKMPTGVILVFGTAKTSQLAFALFQELEGVQIITVTHGETGTAGGVTTDFYSASAGEALYQQVKFQLNAVKLTGVIDLTAYDAEYEQSTALEAGKLTFLQKLIANDRQQGYCLLQATYCLNNFKIAKTTMQGARLAGLYRMLGTEYRQIKTLTMDTDCPLDFYQKAAEQIQAEFLNRQLENYSECCYRNDIRYEPILKTNPMEVESQVENRIPQKYQPEEVVLITGGSRGIGAAIAAHIVSQGVKNLVIMGREELPEPSAWETVIAKHEHPGLAEKLKRFRSYIERGVKVGYYSTPLGDEAGIRAMVEQIHQEFGRITGVFHCAGLVSKTPVFFEKQIADIDLVCEPKINGLVTLDRVLAGEPLNFFGFFSSISGIAPTLAVGQSDYAMANAYMDYYAMNQTGQGKIYMKSLQWPAWGETGMAVGRMDTPAYRSSGLVAHTTVDGLALLDAVKQSDYIVSAPCVILPDQFIPNQLLQIKMPSLSREPFFKPAPALETTGSIRELRLTVREWLEDIFKTKLKLTDTQWDSDKSFDEYGVDSILFAQLVTAMQERIDQPLDPSLLLQFNTLDELAEYFMTHHGEAFGDIGGLQREIASGLPGETAKDIIANPSAEPAGIRVEPENFGIAIVGIACRLPGAPDKEAYWNLLTQGITALKPVPEERWSPRGDRRDFGGWLDEIDRFDARFFNIHETDAALMDPQARIILEESLKAIYDAGYAHKQLSGRKIGVYIGGRLQPNSDMAKILHAPNPVLGLGQNYMAANISRFFNFTGPSMVVDTACSSGLTGLSLAAEALQGRRIDMALAGAVSLLLSPDTFELFAARNILSKNGEFHIFEETADGEVLGEGAGVVILKRLDDAIRDGNRIYGVIRAVAVNNDGRTIGPGSPNINTQKQVMKEALALSGKDIAEIGYIEVNGGGSPVVDAVEIKSLTEAYHLDDQNMEPCFLGSIKPNIGHLLLTSGMAELIRCVLSVYHQRIPPFLSAKQPFPYYDFGNSRIRFNRAAIDWEVPPGRKRTAALNSFPDGGTNCHLIIEEFTPDPLIYQPRFYPVELPVMDRKVFKTGPPNPKTDNEPAHPEATPEVPARNHRKLDNLLNSLIGQPSETGTEKAAGFTTKWGEYHEAKK